MLRRHGFNKLPGEGAGVVLLDELREDAFEIGQGEQAFEVGWSRVGADAAAGEDDDAVADLLDDFEHVRDVEDGFAARGEFEEQVFEEAGGDDIEAGEWLVEDQKGGIVQQRRGDQYALLHAFGVGREGGVAPGLEGKELKQAVGLAVE